MLGARLDELVCAFDVTWSNQGHTSLDARRIASDLRAPLVENCALACEGLNRPEPVPDVRVLRREAQGNGLTLATDQHGQRPERGRVEPCESGSESDDARFERRDPRRDGAELE